MAEPATQPTGSAPAKKRKKSYPTWYYIAGAGALLVAYYAYAKSQANKAAAAATSSQPVGGAGSSAGTAASSYGNAGDLAALAPYLTGASTSGASTGSGAAFTLPSNESFFGSGYGVAPSATVTNGVPSLTTPPSTAVSSASGANYVQVSQANIGQLLAAGTPVYYQPAPGVFSALPSGATSGNLQGLVGTTPLFIQQGTGS